MCDPISPHPFQWLIPFAIFNLNKSCIENHSICLPFNLLSMIILWSETAQIQRIHTFASLNVTHKSNNETMEIEMEMYKHDISSHRRMTENRSNIRICFFLYQNVAMNFNFYVQCTYCKLRVLDRICQIWAKLNVQTKIWTKIFSTKKNSNWNWIQCFSSASGFCRKFPFPL